MRSRVRLYCVLTCFACLLLFLVGDLPARAATWVDLTVTIGPAEVANSARFILGGDDHASGTTISVLASTNYVIEFTDVAEFQKPGPITVYVAREPVSVTATYVPSSAGDPGVTVSDMTVWPLWPRKRIAYNVWEPHSFLSVGRDVVAWVIFDPMADNPTFWVSDLNIMVRTGDIAYSTVIPDFSYAGQSYHFVAGGVLRDFPTALTGIIDDLRSHAVTPGYMGAWMTETSGDISENFPNQDFNVSWFSYSGWLDFLRGNAGFELEDSGHAPPLTMWAEDNWLTYFVDEDSIPSAWVGKVFIFLPTNQGVLNCFEVSEDPEDTYARRTWSITPFPAFHQAVYNQVRYENDGMFSRMTVLDGPTYVHDVQDQYGNWKRVLIGSTGLGTEQENKTGSNWALEGAPRPPDPPDITDNGRIFGIYALDVTDPLNPVPLWSVTNVSCTRNQNASVSRVDIRNAPGGAIDAADYAQVDFMTSKPLVGFTETVEGERTWHLLLVTVDKDGEYLWINADPLTGEVMTTGTFDGFNGETTETLPPESTYHYNFEDWYPSRVLAAYPGEGGMPVLSDVYVYLSNGTFYLWDLNRYGWSVDGSNSGAPVPEKIFNVYTNTSKEFPAPPITDFDICYINGETYLAATVPLDYPGIGSPHDTYGLLIVNLTRIQEDGTVDLNTQSAVGQGGDTKLLLTESGVAMVQLQTGTGGNAYDFDVLAASPIFANYVLYQAQYSTDGDLSRLYTLDMGYIAGLSRNTGNIALPDDSYIDDPENRYASMIIDAQGNLVIFDEEGNIVQVIEGILNYDDLGTGTGETGSTGVRTFYWKTM